MPKFTSAWDIQLAVNELSRIQQHNMIVEMVKVMHSEGDGEPISWEAERNADTIQRLEAVLGDYQLLADEPDDEPV